MTARASRVLRAGSWSAPVADEIALPYDDRYRRRRAMTADGGLSFLLDLDAATELRDGDGLGLEDGRVVRVRSAPEPVADLTATDATHLVRLAWHLGNRHLPTQLMGDRLRIRRDHVIERMAEGLGAVVTRLDAPFDPEGGAFGDGHGHRHAHSHGHGHGHGHGNSDGDERDVAD